MRKRVVSILIALSLATGLAAVVTPAPAEACGWVTDYGSGTSVSITHDTTNNPYASNTVYARIDTHTDTCTWNRYYFIQIWNDNNDAAGYQINHRVWRCGVLVEDGAMSVTHQTTGTYNYMQNGRLCAAQADTYADYNYGDSWESSPTFWIPQYAELYTIAPQYGA